MEKFCSDLVIFYYVIEFMSFTKAAQHLHCSKAHVSKRVADFERVVGAPLLHRNTRSLKMTQEGESLFKHAQSIIQELQYAENTMQSLQNKAAGTLRITSPFGYAQYVIAPNLPTFLEKYPEINLEMKHSGDYLDLIKEKIDVAIRITHEPPLDRVAKRLGTDSMMICASKAYLEKHGAPTSPKQLHSHPCLVYSSEKSLAHWPFYEKGELVEITVKPRMMSNNIVVLLEAVLGGFGIARLPQFAIEKQLKNKELVPLLIDYNRFETPIYAIYSQSRIIPPKIQVFIKFLEEMQGLL